MIEIKEGKSKREIFLVCGKLVEHYSIAGWLRTVYSYIKRKASGISRESKVDDERLL